MSIGIINENTETYHNWYVLYVTVGKEWHIKSIIEKYAEKPIKLTIFQREFLHKRNGESVKVTGVLFAGYIFLQQEINEALKIARKYLYSERIFPISINRKPCMVYEDEMKLLLNNSDDEGLFRLSKGKKVKDKVVITAGALKNIQGNIIWIDEKKKKAKVAIQLFQRPLKVNLGLDIIQNVS